MNFSQLNYITNNAVSFSTTGGSAVPPDDGIDHLCEPMPATHRLSVLLKFDLNRLTIEVAVDSQVVCSKSGTWTTPSAPVLPFIFFQCAGLNNNVIVNRFRCRKLVPYIEKAANFVPQTSSAIYFLPNAEDGISFLEFLALNDNAEFRLKYNNSSAAKDEIELNAVGTLGRNASAEIGYYDAPLLSVPVSPFSIGAEKGSFLNSPPFRFEEGYNMASTPQKESRQTPHANEVTVLGSGQGASQLQATLWSQAETGNPAASVARTYPNFEAVVDEKRAVLLSLVQGLATTSIARALDTTPSLTVDIVDSIENAFQWRAGDSIWTRTKSLINNVEQLMRIQRVTVTAGSALRSVTLGKKELDPELQSLMARDMLLSWLYDQNSSFGTVFIYPIVPNVIAASGNSPTWSIPLDQFTSGSAIVSAKLRWFATTGQPVSDISARIGTSNVATTVAGTDSGDIDVTSLVRSPVVYTLNFHNNNGGATRTLVSAFLTVQLRI